jgi:hypothetical protein
MSRGRLVSAWGVALLATLGLAALSRASWRAHPEPNGAIRLTWSARPEQIETCRRLSEAELAERPVHMRQEVMCEGAAATYRLQVWLDERQVDDEVLQGGGMRNDRPIYVLRDYPAPPGRYRLRVAMRRVESVAGDTTGAAADTGMSLDRGVREAEERRRRRLEAVPAELWLDETVVLAARQVALVTWDAETRRLRMVK